MVQFSNLEKQGIKRAMRRGLLNQIRHGLDIKFPRDAEMLFVEIQRVTSLNVLKMVEDQIYLAKSPEDLRKLYRNQL